MDTLKTGAMVVSWYATSVWCGYTSKLLLQEPQEGCNLVTFVRQQRFQWVGHILRRHESFPARRMLMKQQKPYEKGSVLMDAPRHDNMVELAELAQDRKSWRATKLAIGSSKQCATPPSHQRGMRTRGAARRQLEFRLD